MVVLGAIAIALLIAFIVGMVIFFPIITIWSLNLLFGLSIPYTIYTWLATWWLAGIVGSKISGLKGKKS